MRPEEFVTWEKKAAGIDYKVEYTDLARGDVPAGVLLSQIVYWCLPSNKSGKSKLTVQREGRLWIAKSKEDWYRETRLNRDVFDHARAILENEELIYSATFQFRRLRTLHIALRLETFLPAMAKVVALQNSEAPPENGE